MGRYRPTGTVQTPIAQAGDIGFLGVNNRLDPSQLEPGTCADAVNKRFTHGVAGDRKGIRKLNWLNRVALDGAVRKIDPYGIIYGTGKFRDPNGVEWDVVAADGQVYASRENQYPAAAVPLPAGVMIASPVTFTQAFNVLLLFRGEALAVLQLDRIEEGFKAIPTAVDDLVPNTVTGTDSENPTDGTEPIPNADRGLFFQNRVFIPYNRDLVAVSDYLNYTRFSPIRSVFRINQGSNDRLVALGRFNETTLIAFKEQSIYAIGNILGDLSGATLYEITSEYGCAAPKSIVAVGKDLWFLADKRGVCSVTLTEQNKIQGVNVPVSQDIERTIERINWRYAAGATAAYWQNRLYMAVPLDNAEVLKTSLVPAGAVYDSNGLYQVAVRAGRSYRWTAGTEDDLAVVGTGNVSGAGGHFNGSGNLAVDGLIPGDEYLWIPQGTATSLTNGINEYDADDGAVIFVAATDTVTFQGTPLHTLSEIFTHVFRKDGGDLTPDFDRLRLYGAPGEAITASLQPVFQGVNNAVLVYDFQNAKWSGHDESAVLAIKDWALTTVDGRQRLVFFSADGSLNLYEEGGFDENIYEESAAPIVVEPVRGSLLTRGYLCDTVEPKSFLRVLLSLSTLNPTYSLDLLTDGMGELHNIVTDRTKNRLKYYRPHDKADWNPDNSAGDYLTPFREDYAWVMGASDSIFLDTKIDPERMQEIEEKFWSKGRGKYAQVRLVNTGRVELRSLNLEAVLASKRFGVHA